LLKFFEVQRIWTIAYPRSETFLPLNLFSYWTSRWV